MSTPVVPPEATANESHVDELLTLPDSWILRHCDCYRDEYKSCKSIRGRLHQFYVYGRILDCADWENNVADCKAWNKYKDREAALRVIEREKLRVGTRLRDHFDNDVWKKRKCPPEDWAKPLPDWLKEKSDDSYLAIYMKEKEEERQGALSESGLIAARAKVKTALPSCVIM